jgi:hypothetical protein
MSQALIHKIRKAREIAIYEGGHGFTVRRPTDLEAATLRGQKMDLGDFLKKFVTGWTLRELDIIPGGNPVDVPFDADLFAEWIADKPHLWQPLQTAIFTAYESHLKKLDDAVGEPGAG